jgi:hypothetical protein
MTMTDRMYDAAQRALDALTDLIRNTFDPGVEALGARYELAHVLSDPTLMAARDAARQAAGQPAAACGCGEPGTPGIVHRPAAPCYVDETAADPTTADDPVPLRWGLNDVLYGDDDTITVCLSGPDREPYRLELAPDQAAALRNDLADPDAPLSPYYSHEACGFHWHGRDGMDIPTRDGQPVCPRCELLRMTAEVVEPCGKWGGCVLETDHSGPHRHTPRRVEVPQDHPGAELYAQLRKAGNDHETTNRLIYAHARMAVRQHQALHGDTPAVGLAAPTNHDTETEAHPMREGWRIEIWDVDGWVPSGLIRPDREVAIEYLAARRKHRPDAKLRLVRETTTWTVEEDETR